LESQDIISSGILELYAAGIATSKEREQVEHWVKQYPEVAAELHAIQLGIENYAQANAIAPGDKVKDKLFTAINTAPVTKNTTSNGNVAATAKIVPVKNYWKWVAAASIVLLVGSAVTNYIYFNKYDTASKDLKETQQQLAQTEQKNTEFEGDLDIVHNRNSVPVSLTGQPTAPGADAKIFWMKNTGEVMVDASNLPDAPAGMQYQFWGIVDGKPVDGGLLITNDKGRKFLMQRMKSFGRAEAFAISLEKEGGSPAPTYVVSMGKI
jgi:anti-sigma-K factor RskA